MVDIFVFFNSSSDSFSGIDPTSITLGLSKTRFCAASRSREVTNTHPLGETEHKNINHTLPHYKPCYRNIKHTPKACQACKAAIAPLLKGGAPEIME